MKSIIKNTINSCFIVWLKIFEPIKSKEEVLTAERYDIKHNKEKWIVVRSRKTKEIEFKSLINKKENKKR